MHCTICNYSEDDPEGYLGPTELKRKVIFHSERREFVCTECDLAIRDTLEFFEEVEKDE